MHLFAVFDQLASILVLGQAADSSVRLSGTPLPTAMDPEHFKCCSRTNSPLEQQQGSTRRQEGRFYAKHPTILQQGSRKVSVAAILHAQTFCYLLLLNCNHVVIRTVLDVPQMLVHLDSSVFLPAARLVNMYCCSRSRGRSR